MSPTKSARQVLKEEMLSKQRPPQWDKVFEKELFLIADKKVRDFTLSCLERAPGYFWFSAASISGKYHSSFGQGDGGLVRHTRALCHFSHQLVMECDPLGLNKKFDSIISAGILHDLVKYGFTFEYDDYLHHGEIAAKLVYEWGKGIIEEEQLSEICNMILFHLGPYEKRSNTLPWQDKLVKKTHYLIQICDIMASRKDIDIIGLFNDPSTQKKNPC